MCLLETKLTKSNQIHSPHLSPCSCHHTAPHNSLQCFLRFLFTPCFSQSLSGCPHCLHTSSLTSSASTPFPYTSSPDSTHFHSQALIHLVSSCSKSSSELPSIWYSLILSPPQFPISHISPNTSSDKHSFPHIPHSS